MILRNTSATISVTFTVDGAGTDPSPDSATVAIYREDGTELVAETAATDAGTGIFTYALTPAKTAQLDVLRAVWQLTYSGQEQTLTTYHEVVGGFMCTLAQISAAVAQLGGTAPATEDLVAARARAERFLEDRCGVAFRSRYAREKSDGDGSHELLLGKPRPLALSAVSIGGTALTAEELDEIGVYGSGILYRAAGWTQGRRNVEVKYEHGFASPPPEADRVAAKLARFYLQPQPKNYDERATRIDTDGAAYDFMVTAGVRGAETSIPEVNRFIADHRYVPVG